MERIRSPTVAFVLIVFIRSVTSLLEDNIGELQFTIPDATGNFADAVSWCKTNNNSTLAIVNDSNIQTALYRFLNSSQPTSTMYINMKLSQNTVNKPTWFLINGSEYPGYVGHQDPREDNYLLYCHLRHDVGLNRFVVDASAPSEIRNYICDFEDNMCPIDSVNNTVYNRRCYVKYETKQVTWYQARERCIKNGGDLARFQTESNNYAPPFNTSWLDESLTYWIGIRWNDWSWKPSESGQEYIFTSWSNEEPNNYSYGCVCLNPNGRTPWSWTDCDCTTPKQFVCLKKVAIPTTTAMTTTTVTTTMNPTTTAELVTTTLLSVITTRLAVTTVNSTTMNMPLVIGLAAGLGGGGLILLIVIIAVVVVIWKRRQRKSDGSSKSGSEENINGENSDNTQNGVYAAVVPGKVQGKQTEAPSETIYTSPIFTKEQNSPPPDHSYETVDLVEEPQLVRSFNKGRGQTKSIFPQGYGELYANAKEVPHATD